MGWVDDRQERGIVTVRAKWAKRPCGGDKCDARGGGANPSWTPD